MLSFKDYVEKAKENQGVKTTVELAKMIDITQAAVCRFSDGKGYPSQETVYKLATLAGVKPEQALIDFNLWKTKDYPNAQRIWQKMSKMIGVFALAYVINGAFSNSYNLDNSADYYHLNGSYTVYYE